MGEKDEGKGKRGLPAVSSSVDLWPRSRDIFDPAAMAGTALEEGGERRGMGYIREQAGNRQQLIGGSQSDEGACWNTLPEVLAPARYL